jgi:mono/diheme cytochrome c family protein
MTVATGHRRVTTRSRAARSKRARLLGAAAAATALLLVAACSRSDREAVSKAEPGPIPAAVQRPGDPEIGREVVTSGRYMTCGMPYSAWRRVSGAPAIGAGGDAAAAASGGGALPYYMSVSEDERGVEIVNPNCLLCHGALFDGEPVIGLGDETLDFTSDPNELADAVGAYALGPEQADAWRKWADRIAAIAPYMITDTVGVNPAPNLTLALIAHRDAQTLAWHDAPQLEPPPERPLPVSVPPWWRMGKKHAMFYNGMGRGDHARFMMMKSLVCTDSVDEAERIDEMFTHVRAYIASLEPPEFPYPIDEALAARGEPVFEEHCASCHGTYGPDGEYPNRLVPLDVVGTDPAYARQAYEDADRFMSWFNRSWYGELAEARPALGYVAPPLDGVWITAPFLHNGSVPTIDALLDSRKRPTYWIRSFDSGDYDPETLGFAYRAVDYGKAGAESRRERARIYDTTLPGYSNAGHTFGDELTDDERRALLEYIKTL